MYQLFMSDSGWSELENVISDRTIDGIVNMADWRWIFIG